MKTRIIAVLFLLSNLLAQQRVYPERWVYVSNDLSTEKRLEQFRQIAETAAAHGLTAIMFSSAFDRIDLQTPDYIQRLKQARDICRQHGLELIPAVFYTGYGSGILAHDKNLAEGLLAKDALFVVSGNEAHFTPEVSTSFTNGGFEKHEAGHPSGYLPGVKASIDTQVFHTGRASLRLEGFGEKADDSAHIVQEISVRPYRQYRLSCWVKTEAVKPTVYFGIHVSTDDGRSLHPWEPRLSGTTDWRLLVSGFNSGNSAKLRLDIGVFEAQKGTIGKVWIDDVNVEEVGLLNVIRRAGTPLVVRDEKTGTVYQEGRDYAEITDPNLNFRWNHDCPTIRLLADSRIRDGARLRVSYYHGTTIYESQVTICLSEPKVYQIWQDQIRIVHELLKPRKYMMSMDELRMGGSCETCKRRGLSMAQIVGDATTRQFQMIRSLDPQAEIFVWSDMYDPNHNARPKYYLVEGDLTGSWQYIPKDLRMVCWYFEKRRASLDFFSKLKFKTLAGAYYDGDNLDNVRGWLEALDHTPGAIGIMYTTWQNKYQLLSAFGDLVSKPR